VGIAQAASNASVAVVNETKRSVRMAGSWLGCC
jgi:hypothetical protein